jgi:hypothetical protein
MPKFIFIFDSFGQYWDLNSRPCACATLPALFCDGYFLSVLFLKCKAREFIEIEKYKVGGVPVAHTCNPNYSEGRDQEDQDSISKKSSTKKHWWSSLRCKS